MAFVSVKGMTFLFNVCSCLFICFLFFPSRENGEFEEVIILPSHSRLSPPEGQEQQQQTQEQEERAPVVAFRENGLLKPISGVEDISAQQGPGQYAVFFISIHKECLVIFYQKALSEV